MDSKHNAFEVVHTDYPLFKEEVEEWVDEQDTDEWLIEFDIDEDDVETTGEERSSSTEFLDRENRRTTIGGLAFYAAQFDDSASVMAL